MDSVPNGLLLATDADGTQIEHIYNLNRFPGRLRATRVVPGTIATDGLLVRDPVTAKIPLDLIEMLRYELQTAYIVSGSGPCCGAQIRMQKHFETELGISRSVMKSSQFALTALQIDPVCACRLSQIVRRD